MELENFRITKNEKLQKSQNFINLNVSDKTKENDEISTKNLNKSFKIIKLRSEKLEN